jgi:phosphate transport system substrate-binding protein
VGRINARSFLHPRALAAGLLFLAACSGSHAGAAGGGTQITGAGSTFDDPFFSRAFYQYTQSHPDVSVNYQAIGSGGGIRQFIAKTVDFGATDVPMSASELKSAGAPVVQIPVALGGEAIAYNLPDLTAPLKLTRSALAGIYLGKILKWNDPAIASANPGVKLPDLSIAVVHRSDGSGTTYIFTDFLSAISAEWKAKVGAGKSVQWPAQNSVGGKGNAGVAGDIRNTPGAIGYVELAYALENKMQTALVQNHSGAFVACSAQSVSADAASKPAISAKDFSIVDGAGAAAYPISGYSWAIAYAHPQDAKRGKLVHDILAWLIGPDAQAIASSVKYVPLPPAVSGTARASLNQMIH